MEKDAIRRSMFAKLFDFLFRKIRAKVIIFEILLILFVAGMFGSIVTLNLENILTTKAHQFSERIVRDLAMAIKFDSEPDSLDAVKSYTGIEGVIYLGYSGIIISGDSPRKTHLYIGNKPIQTTNNKGKRIEFGSITVSIVETNQSSTNKPSFIQQTTNFIKILSKQYRTKNVMGFQISNTIEQGFEYYIPVVVKELNNKKIGGITLCYSKSIIDKEIERLRYLIFIITGVITLIGIFISIRGANSIVRPLLKLTKLVKKFGEGDLSVKINLSSRDEIGTLANSFDNMVISVREKLEMQKFVSTSTVKMIENSVSADGSGDTSRQVVTLFFTDIRGFTAMSEKLDPQDVVNILNLFLDIQTNIIRKYDGDIDKFVGDEIVAVFTGKGKNQKAVLAAREIQKKLAKLNRQRAKDDRIEVQVGIGINTGEVIVGSIGSHDRMDYTVIGDNVNLAARLCSAAARGEIIISKSVWTSLPKKDKITPLDPISVKGKVKPIEVFRVDY